MRYRYFSVLNCKNLLIILVLILALMMAFRGYRQVVKLPLTVNENVYFAGSNLGGLTSQEAEAVVLRLMDGAEIPAVDAVIDPQTKGVIPDLNGLMVDVSATLEKIIAAPGNSDVEPVYIEMPAQVTMADFPEHPLYQGNPHKQQVTFLINVAWGNEYLQEMLDVLQAEDAQATFFLVGRWAEANEADVKKIENAGFEIANHGYSDALSMAQASYDVAVEDIKKANDILEQLTGSRPVFFSPHKGELNDNVLKAAAAENNRLVLWTVDTVDWMLPGVNTMVEKILKNSDNGSLILMHPTEQTPEFLRQVIPQLRQLGLEPVTLQELINPKRQNGGVITP